jgi:tryptophan 7-halogenase
MDSPGMLEHVLVLGGGSAGYLTAITLKIRLPKLRVTVLRSKDIGIIGVGEGTTVTIPQHLHDYLGIPMKEFWREAEPQWKLGIRYLWGPRPFFDYVFGFQIDTKYALLSKPTGYYIDGNGWDYVGVQSGLMTENKVCYRDITGWPVFPVSPAYHIENEKFVGYLERYANKIGVITEDDTVENVLQDERGVAGLQLVSGRTMTADLYADCSGFASLLLEKTLGIPFRDFKRTLFNDRAVVGGWKRTDEPIKPYTTAETMNSGWCWQIEHEGHINRGYVFSSDFISDEDATAEFCAKNPKVMKTRMVRFRVGRHERTWHKNVVAIGNASGFVEPLESTGLGLICAQAEALAEVLLECGSKMPNEYLIKHCDLRLSRQWDQIVAYLATHFKFNTRYDTPYWRACWNDCDLAGAEEVVSYYQAVGPSVLARDTLLDYNDQFGMEGYLTMLVGQKVPTRHQYMPTQQEQMNWQRIQQAVKNRVAGAYTVAEALKLVRSDAYQWPKNMYHVPVGRGSTVGTAREITRV